MERTIWNDGVEVTQTQLANEHGALSTNILQRWIDGMSTGVVSGLEVTVSGTNATRVNMAAGHGYALNGEWTELATPVSGIALANYANGTDNYVCLVYTEIASTPAPHETAGQTRNTKASRSAQVRVYTLATLNALPADSVLSPDGTVDFSVDTRDRILICAIVSANGAAVDLTASDITSPTIQDRILSIVQPSVMTGVEIIDIDSSTETTNERLVAGDTTVIASGQLRMTVTFAFPAAPTSITLAYKAPGDSVFGPTSGNIILGGSPLTLASTNGHWVKVGWSVPLLPKGDFASSPHVITETLTVTAIYDQPVLRNGARDEQLRHLGRGVVPSSTNPNGLKLKDLGAASNAVPGTLYLGTNLLSTAAQLLAPRVYTELPLVLAGGLPVQRMLLWDSVVNNTGVPSFTPHVRIYATFSAGLLSAGMDVTVNARWAEDGAGAYKWVADSTMAAAMFGLYNDGGGDAVTAFLTKASTGTPWDDTTWTVGYTIGSGGILRVLNQVLLGANNLTSATGIHTPRVTAAYSTTVGMKYTLMWQSAPASGALPTVRIYVSQLNSGEGGLYITVNARWDQTLFAGAGGWAADAAGYASSSFGFLYTAGATFFRHFSKLAGAGSWTEFDWLTTTQTQGLTADAAYAGGNIVASGDIRTISASYDFKYGSAKTFYRSFGASGAQFRGPLTEIDISVSGLVSVRKTAPSIGYATFPIYLPQGATVTGARMNGSFTPLGGVINVRFLRRRHDDSGFPESLSSVPQTIPVTYPTYTYTPIDQNNVVDNNLYHYYVWFHGTDPSEWTIWSVDVTYTVTTVAV